MFEGEVAGKKPRKARAKKAMAAKPARKPRTKPKHDLAAQVETLGADSLLPPAQKRKARKPRPFTINITAAFAAMVGMNKADAEALEAVTHIIAECPKKSRAKIVVALGKVFT